MNLPCEFKLNAELGFTYKFTVKWTQCGIQIYSIYKWIRTIPFRRLKLIHSNVFYDIMSSFIEKCEFPTRMRCARHNYFGKSLSVLYCWTEGTTTFRTITLIRFKWNWNFSGGTAAFVLLIQILFHGIEIRNKKIHAQRREPFIRFIFCEALSAAVRVSD